MMNNVGQWWLFWVGGSEEWYRKLFRMGEKIEGYLFRVGAEIGSIYRFTASGWGNREYFRCIYRFMASGWEDWEYFQIHG